MFFQQVCFILLFLISVVYNVKSLVQDHAKQSAVFYREPLPTDDPKIYYMSVSTNVANRYATTLVTCRIKNPSVVAKEATFSVVLPERAFISNFVMEINNKSYQAYVKEKEEAQKIYDTAVQQGQAAAQVKVNARDSSRFSVNINLQPEAQAVFLLTYEELLVRKLGMYEIVLNIFPGQLVDNLGMEVTINESQPLKFVNQPTLRQAHRLNGKNERTDARLVKRDTSALVQYNPDVYEQRRVARSWETGERFGLAAQFVVQYDVERKASGGQIIQSRSNFAHFFTPVNTTNIPKYVIFVLDTSGSMDGEKITQLKEAMKNIFKQLDEADYFNIIEFSTTARVWNVETGEITYQEEPADQYDFDYFDVNYTANVIPPYHAASKTNKDRAIKMLNLFTAYGGTDIFAALKVGLMVLEKNNKMLSSSQPIILFLTDGEVNRGVRDYSKIIDDVTKLNQHKVSIFALSLGMEANKNFLDKLSLKNKGNTKHIYESEDINLQLETFFKEIASPQLKDVEFSYGSNVSELTRKTFPTAYAGGELVVVGKKREDVDLGKSTQISVSATSGKGKVQLVPSVETATDNMRRLWAYLKVKQLLEQRKIVENNAAITKRALNLALKYSFVTEVTSLVVVKPEQTKIVETKAVEDDDFTQIQDSVSSTPSTYVPSVWGGNGKKQVGEIYPENNKTIDTPLPKSTTTPYPEITSPEAIVRINKVKQEIPWLADKLGSTGIISIKSGEYNMDFVTNKTIKPDECEFVGNNTRNTGSCVRMHECEDSYKTYTDEDYLGTLLCPLWYKFYFGVCCSYI